MIKLELNCLMELLTSSTILFFFARKMPTRSLPVPGDVALLNTVDDDVDVLVVHEAVLELLREQRHLG